LAARTRKQAKWGEKRKERKKIKKEKIADS